MAIQTPTPEDVRALRERHKLTQPDLSELVHASVRTVQHWETPSQQPEYRQMPLASWELAQLKLGETTLDRSKSAKAKARKERAKAAAEPKAVAEPTPAAVAALPEDRLAELRRLALTAIL